MARGKIKTTAEKLEEISGKIENLELQLKELKAQKKELEAKREKEEQDEILDLIKKSGKSFDEIRNILS